MENIVSNLAANLVPLGFFAMIVLVIWVVHRSKEIRAKARAETQRLFLDKFESGKELAEFIESENGKRFMQELSEGPADDFDDHRRRGLIVPGLILSFMGVGMMTLTFMGNDMIVPGVILFCIGAGFLASIPLMNRMAVGSKEPAGQPQQQGRPH